MAEGKSGYWDVELFEWIAADLLNTVRSSEKPSDALESIEYNAPDDVYTAAMEQNLFHFSAAKTLAEVQELNQAFRNSSNYNDFKSKAARITATFNDRWQKTEHRPAIQLADSASQYRQLKAAVKTLPFGVYRTVGDDRVRPEHAVLDGLTLPADPTRSTRPMTGMTDAGWMQSLPMSLTGTKRPNGRS